jgi:hypothetical protein
MLHPNEDCFFFWWCLDTYDVWGRLRKRRTRRRGSCRSYSVLLVGEEVSHTVLSAVRDGNDIPSWNVGFTAGVVLCQLAIEESDP